jgi:D-sedoheptulose 7-phosphate isomerase
MNLVETNKAISLISQKDRDLLLSSINSANQIILIGNGGSNAIASHIAVDYIKFLSKKSLAFSDASMLTASMNDYGTENAYAKYIDSYKDNNTLVILISSSGNSLNIYNAAKYCYENNIKFILLTGFDSDNKTRKEFSTHAILDYWIDSHSYGVVECVHQIFLHSIIDN